MIIQVTPPKQIKLSSATTMDYTLHLFPYTSFIVQYYIPETWLFFFHFFFFSSFHFRGVT